MRDKRDRRKKRFIEALTLHGMVYHAAKAAGVFRQTAYRWRHEDRRESLISAFIVPIVTHMGVY